MNYNSTLSGSGSEWGSIISDVFETGAGIYTSITGAKLRAEEAKMQAESSDALARAAQAGAEAERLRLAGAKGGGLKLDNTTKALAIGGGALAIGLAIMAATQ